LGLTWGCVVWLGGCPRVRCWLPTLFCMVICRFVVVVSMMSRAEAEVAGYLARWRRSPAVSAEAAAFARDVVRSAGAGDKERAKSLLAAASRLAARAAGLGLEPVPGTLLHPSVTERFAWTAPGLSAAARRTHRANLRFIARRVVPHLHPADLPLPRERARAPYGPAEIAGFLALAAAQPTRARRLSLLSTLTGAILSVAPSASASATSSRQMQVPNQIHQQYETSRICLR
jgi:hypothetical protein